MSQKRNDFIKTAGRRRSEVGLVIKSSISGDATFEFRQMRSRLLDPADNPRYQRSGRYFAGRAARAILLRSVEGDRVRPVRRSFLGEGPPFLCGDCGSMAWHLMPSPRSCVDCKHLVRPRFSPPASPALGCERLDSEPVCLPLMRLPFLPGLLFSLSFPFSRFLHICQPRLGMISAWFLYVRSCVQSPPNPKSLPLSRRPRSQPRDDQRPPSSWYTPTRR